VVADLEHVDGPDAPSSDSRLDDLLLRVARQQHRRRAIASDHNDAGLVGCRILHRLQRRGYIQRHRTDVERVARLELAHRVLTG
jgi:hypothetical protein